jgi:hypothetical protein
MSLFEPANSKQISAEVTIVFPAIFHNTLIGNPDQELSSGFSAIDGPQR